MFLSCVVFEILCLGEIPSSLIYKFPIWVRFTVPVMLFQNLIKFVFCTRKSQHNMFTWLVKS